MTAAGGTPDARLVARVLEGEQDAFAEVYERYADRLFDFAVGMLRNREDASDAVADSFVTMAERLSQLRDPSRLRPWLYAVVRRECLRRLKARTRVAFDADDQLAAIPDAAASPEQQTESAALRELVWAAAEGLNERDQALLDLHLRHGLEGQELADVLGITAGNAYTSLNRLKSQLERALGALLIARRGSDDCPALAAVLHGWDGSFSVLVRKRVARHVDQCLACSDRQVALAPLSLVAGIPILVAPSSLRDRVLGDVHLVHFDSSAPESGAPQSSAPQSSAPQSGAPESGDTQPGDPVRTAAASDVRRRRLARLLPAVAALIAIATLAVVAVLDRDAGPLAELDSDLVATPPVAASSTPATPSLLTSPDPLTPRPTPTPTAPLPVPPSTAPSTTAPPAQPPTPAPDVVVVKPTLLDLGEVARAGTVTLTNVSSAPVDYTLSTTATWVVLPGGGTLAPGGTTAASVFVDRSTLPEGPSEAVVTVSWAGGETSFTVRASVPAAPGSGPSILAP